MENKKNITQCDIIAGNKNGSDSKPPPGLRKNDDGENSKKYKFYRKPPTKKKGPEVKQTKTSLKRLLQANPLLKSEGSDQKFIWQNSVDKNSKFQVHQHSASKNSTLLSQSKSEPIDTLSSVNKSTRYLPKIASRCMEPASSTPRPDVKAVQLKPNPFKEPYKVSSKPKTINAKQATVSNTTDSQESTQQGSSKFSKQIRQSLSSQYINGKKGKNSQRLSKPVRRSVSAQNIDRNKKISKNETGFDRLNKTQSAEDVFNGVSPISGNDHKDFVFKTPSAHQRRSIYHQYTPQSTSISRRSIYPPNTPLPTLEALQKRLNEWLAKRGKSVCLFHHLKSFHSAKPVDEENKENIEIDQDLNKGSYEDLQIVKPELENMNWESIAKAALIDLNNLIQEGYPVLQCEEWLNLIRTKFEKLQETPEYWECRAAIEQSRGNISDAVECYRTAIVQGAEVQVVDKSLDVLLQKFSLLNISTEKMKQNPVDNDRARIVTCARNIFKSSIINFAVQEKKLKKNNIEVNLIVTPVRRSTRLSRSAYSTTPGVKICSSLKELDDKEVVFVQNKALD